MDKIRKLLLENLAWAEAKKDMNPQYFETMAKDQNPEFLWIGCSDSRVPETEITNSSPGEIFVHRNIANMVIHSDLNLMSVLTYAVNALKVPHVIICGHYNCGGVKGALSGANLGLINHWIAGIRDTYFSHKKEIDTLSGEMDRVNRLVELNVQEQVKSLIKTPVIQEAWANRKAPHVHGWVYDLANGKLKQICYFAPGSVVEDDFRKELTGSQFSNIQE